nr:hypothetical protein [Secundilactobacillus mixtipabuli]
MIAALGIIMIHFSRTFLPYSLIAGTIARLGVPLFFITTGFYYFRHHERLIHFDWRVFSKATKRLMFLWIIWFIFYSYELGGLNLHGQSIALLAVRSFGGLNIFAGLLWYLIAAVEGLVITQFISIKFGEKGLLITIILSADLTLLSSSYASLLTGYPLIYKVIHFIAAQNSFIVAVLWYCIAIFITRYLAKLIAITNAKTLLLCTVLWGGVNMFCCMFFTLQENQMFTFSCYLKRFLYLYGSLNIQSI